MVDFCLPSTPLALAMIIWIVFTACYGVLDATQPGAFGFKYGMLDAIYFSGSVTSTVGFGDSPAPRRRRPGAARRGAGPSPRKRGPRAPL